MAGKNMQAVITLAGMVDPSLERAVKTVEKKLNGLSKVKNFEKSIGGALKSVGSAALDAGKQIAVGIASGIAAAGTAAASGAVAIGGAALQSYASYEQLVGGIDTLFKDSSGTIQRYAAEAYKTAGVSANTYMEQATNFSASLIQSLGGDTEKAASYADLAIKDMSDNANKMGTSIGSIQQTYQSLMRGNYAMLDNLKLGYGGTKSELERLVKDASELTGKALDPTKFSDVIEAIHAVQENLDITGTTAKEAASTIEGSVNTMKAAWSNWLTGLGREDADMGALTDQLLESLGNVANNIGPRVQIIAQRMMDALPGALKGAASTIEPVLTEVLSGAWNMAAQALGSMGIQLPGIDAGQISQVFSGIGQVVQSLAPAFQSISQALGPIIEGIGSTLAAVMPSVVSGFQGLAQSIGPALSVFTTASPFVTTLAQALGNFAQAVLPPLMSALSGILPLLATIANAILPPIISFITPIASLIMNLVAAVIPPLTSVIQALTPVIQTVVSVAMTLMPIFSGIQSIFTMLTSAVQPLAYTFIPAVGSAFGSLQGPINMAIQFFNMVFSAINSVVTVLGNIISLAGQAASALANIGGGIIGGIGSLLGFRTGGFTNGPYIAGEDPRYPNEAVISFNPGYRAQNIRYWERAGHMLGVSPRAVAETTAATSAGGGGAVYDFSGMTFAPNVEVRGNAHKDDIIAAIRQCEGEFVDMVKEMLARDGEAAYA